MYGRQGRKAYTDSVLSILISNIPSQRPRLRPEDFYRSCPQTMYMNKQTSRSGTKYSVPVQNRFSQLGN